MFCLCAHPTTTIHEHLLDCLTEARKTFQGKILISIGCLHSFQGLLYIIVTLGDILLSWEQPKTCIRTFVHNATSTSCLHAIMKNYEYNEQYSNIVVKKYNVHVNPKHLTALDFQPCNSLQNQITIYKHQTNLSR